MQAIVNEILLKASRELHQLTGNRVIAFVINQEDADKVLKQSVDNLKLAITQMFDIPWSQMSVKCRKRERVLAKQLFCWYATDRIGMSLTEVARLLKKDHTTVIHSRDKIRDFLSIKDEYITERINTLEMYLHFEKIEEVA